VTGAGKSQRGLHAPILEINLERNPQAPSLARAAITGFLDGSDIDPGSLATLTLLVSEVVTNAVIHSDAPALSGILMSARRLDNDTMRVEVTDQGGGFTPAPRDPARPGGGYGLYLVEKEARRWGVDRQGGTRVWFETATQTA
jgi:anti-sigma regulatory factor (Ser/Thr protein kinase)